MNRQTGLLTKIIVAFFVSVLSFSKQISIFLVDSNRYFIQWEFADGLALVLDITVLAVLAVVVSMLFRALKWNRVIRLYNHLFLLALIGGFFSILPFSNDHPRWIQLAWLGSVGVVGFSLAHPRSQLVKYGKYCCLIFSPLVGVLFYQILMVETWGARPEPRPVFRSTQQAAFPVYFFIFDGWSQKKSTDSEGQFLPYFKNLRQLCVQSFVFQQARSPYYFTEQSLPRILFQTDYKHHHNGGQAFFKSKDQLIPTTKVPSMFTMASEHGYHTTMVGYGLPYQKILGDQVEYYRCFSFRAKGESLAERMLITAIRNLAYLTDQISQGLNSRLNPRIMSRHCFEINGQILKEAGWLIENSPNNTFSFFHWQVPHAPCVFNSDGTYYGPYNPVKGMYFITQQDRERQLRYLDLVIGKILDRLRVAGKFDDAMIIITSDHGWAEVTEKKIPELLKHVPLIVKLPHQTSSYVIDKPFANNQLAPVIEQVLRGDINESGFLELIESVQD